jgi:LysM repeat protein
LITHVIILVIAVALVSYSAIGKSTGVALRLGTTDRAGISFGEGGTMDGVEVGRSGTIVAPAAIPQSALVAHDPVTYVATADDDLYGIAQRFQVSPLDIRWSNPADLTHTDLVKAGEKMVIPPVPGVVVTAQKNDTLQNLSQNWHVDPQAVVDFNYLRNPDTDIAPGKVLVLPGAKGPQLEAPDYQPPPTIREDGLVRVGGSPGPVSLNHFPYGQCTWLVASYVEIPFMGDAWMWWGNAQAIGWDTGHTPRPGAIMVTWESRLYGHVAYVQHVYPDKSFEILEMNYVGFAVIDQRLVRPASVPLIGFIYPPGS